MALEPQKPPVQFSYEDRPELSETFADSVYSLMFDGQTLRIIFTVTRVEPSPTGKPTGGKCFPTRRLVLSGAGMAQLLNHVAASRTAALQVALDSVGVPAENAVFIGNDMHRDIFGAREGRPYHRVVRFRPGNKGSPGLRPRLHDHGLP